MRRRSARRGSGVAPRKQPASNRDSLADALQEPARVKRDQKLLPILIDLEPVIAGLPRLHSLHRPRPMQRHYRIPIHVRVLNDQVAASRDETVVKPELLQHMVSGMVGVE